MQTGHFGPTLARIAQQKPSFGSVISRSLGAKQPQMPAYVAVPKAEAFGYQQAHYLGKAFNPFEVGADPNAKDFQVPNLSLPGDLKLKSVTSRRNLLAKFDTLRRDIDKSGVIEGLDTFKAQPWRWLPAIMCARLLTSRRKIRRFARNTAGINTARVLCWRGDWSRLALAV